jgi:DNA-binding Xre family transcriptional regulator
MDAVMTEAKFQLNIKALMLQKSVDTGERITQQQVGEAIGVSIATISRWYAGELDRLDADTVLALMDYFGCEFSDLVLGVKRVD